VVGSSSPSDAPSGAFAGVLTSGGVALVVLVPLVFAVLHAFQFGRLQGVGVVAVAGTVVAATLLLGGALGFLFGIPRALHGGDAVSSDGQHAEVPQYGGNANLEQISDWLTKILVGAGLTQLLRVPDAARAVVDWLAPQLGDVPGSPMLALGLTAYGLVAGFLLGYLWTRLEYYPMLTSAEQGVRWRTEELAERIRSGLRVSEEAGPRMKLPALNSLDPSQAQQVVAVAGAAAELERTGGSLDAESYRALAGQLVAAGRPLDALAVYERVIAVDAHDVRALTWAGAIRAVYLKDFAAARGHYERALELDPDFLPPAYNLACLDSREGRTDEALQRLTAVIKLDAGYLDRAREDAKRDGPFAPLRDDARFVELLDPSHTAAAAVATSDGAARGGAGGGAGET
jgi:hypothetical protein